jgi:uncharacterized membrane protein YhaH (DUF805 family)
MGRDATLIFTVRQTCRANDREKWSCSMLDYVFGLNARLGRLQFVLASVALAVVMTAICFALVTNGLVHFPRGVRPEQVTWAMMGWPIIGAIAFCGVATLMLQAMRIRDIGWDPVCVIGGWIAIVVIDMIVATKLPSLALGAAFVSGVVNLVMTGILLFWPGDEA